jgi:dihydroxyacetone kinase
MAAHETSQRQKASRSRRYLWQNESPKTAAGSWVSPVFKIAGATAEQGLPLDRCLELAERMGGNPRTLFVTLRTATHPTTGQPIFDLGDDEMEIGMGQHGEAGTGRTKMKTPMRQPSSCCRYFRTTSRFSGMTICSSS